MSTNLLASTKATIVRSELLCLLYPSLPKARILWVPAAYISVDCQHKCQSFNYWSSVNCFWYYIIYIYIRIHDSTYVITSVWFGSVRKRWCTCMIWHLINFVFRCHFGKKKKDFKWSLKFSILGLVGPGVITFISVCLVASLSSHAALCFHQPTEAPSKQVSACLCGSRWRCSVEHWICKLLDQCGYPRDSTGSMGRRAIRWWWGPTTTCRLEGQQANFGSNPWTVCSSSATTCSIKCGSCHSSRSEFAGQCQWATGLSASSQATGVSSEEGEEERSLCAIGCSQCMQHLVATPHSTSGLWAGWTFDHGSGPPWSTVAISISRLVARWDPHQCQCQDQHHVGRSSVEISYHGLSLQHLHDEDARQLQDGVGGIHDLVWFSSMRSLGLRDRGCAIARGFSAVQMADHEERQPHVGRCEGQNGRSAARSSGTSWLPLGRWHDSPDQPCVWHDRVAPARDALHTHVRGHSVSRMAGLCRLLGSGWQDLCHFRRWYRGGARLPPLSCGVAARGNFISGRIWSRCRSVGVSLLQRCWSAWCGLQHLCSSTIVVGGQPCVRAYLDQECQVVQGAFGPCGEPWSSSSPVAAREPSCSLDCRDGSSEWGWDWTSHLGYRCGVQSQQPALDQWECPVQERAGDRREGGTCYPSTWSRKGASYGSSAANHRWTCCSASKCFHAQYEGDHWSEPGRASGVSTQRSDLGSGRCVDHRARCSPWSGGCRQWQTFDADKAVSWSKEGRDGRSLGHDSCWLRGTSSHDATSRRILCWEPIRTWWNWWDPDWVRGCCGGNRRQHPIAASIVRPSNATVISLSDITKCERSLMCQRGNWSIFLLMAPGASRYHTSDRQLKSFAGIARLSCSLHRCSCCFESWVDFWGSEAADQLSERCELQVSNPSGAQLWVLSGRSTVETCASNKSWIQLSCIVS